VLNFKRSNISKKKKMSEEIKSDEMVNNNIPNDIPNNLEDEKNKEEMKNEIQQENKYLNEGLYNNKEENISQDDLIKEEIKNEEIKEEEEIKNEEIKEEEEKKNEEIKEEEEIKNEEIKEEVEEIKIKEEEKKEEEIIIKKEEEKVEINFTIDEEEKEVGIKEKLKILMKTIIKENKINQTGTEEEKEAIEKLEKIINEEEEEEELIEFIYNKIIENDKKITNSMIDEYKRYKEDIETSLKIHFLTKNPNKLYSYLIERENEEIDFEKNYKDFKRDALSKKTKYNLNIKDSKGNTPLHYAVKYKKKYSVIILCRFGINKNEVNDNGDTALISSIYTNEPEFVYYLLDSGNYKT
jgi:phosphotransferase system HPr-like phosphotransfer protein